MTKSPNGTAPEGPLQEGSLAHLPQEGSRLIRSCSFPYFQSRELTACHHRGLQAALAVPSQDLSVLMEEAEASLTG